MLPRADISLTPVGRVDALPGVERVADPRQQAFERTLAGSLGKSLQGEILSRLTDGSFLVKVAGTPARMLLPEGAAVGQQVALTLVSLSPRPTFQIATQQGGQPALAYAEAGLPLPAGQDASRAAPLVYLDGGRAPAQPANASTPVQSGHATPSPPAASAPQAAAAAEAHADSAPLVQRPISYAAAQLARAPLIPAERLPAIDPGSTPATLNESARTLANLLAAPGARAPAALVDAALACACGLAGSAPAARCICGSRVRLARGRSPADHSATWDS